MKTAKPFMFAQPIDMQKINLRNDTKETLQSLTDELLQFSRSINQPDYSCFGNELKLAFMLQENKVKPLDFFDGLPQAQFCPRDPRVYFARIASEPMTLSFYQYEKYGLSSKQLFIELSSGLLGRKNEFRKKEMIGSKEKDGTVVAFVKSEELEKSIEHHLLNIDGLSILDTFVYYMNFLFVHPLRDGNGRTARALIHIHLQKGFDISAPFLPLGPWLHHFSREITYAYKEYIEHKNLDNSLMILSKIVSQAIFTQSTRFR